MKNQDTVQKTTIIKQATSAVSDIMDYLIKRNLATKEISQKMAIIDDLILKYKESKTK